MDEKKYKLICVRKGKTNYARTNNRKNVTLDLTGAMCCSFPSTDIIKAALLLEGQ